KGAFHSRTLSHFLNQESDSACSAQKPAGSSAARFQSLSYSAMPLTLACATKADEGAKVRVSLRTLVILVERQDIVGTPIAAFGSSAGHILPSELVIDVRFKISDHTL